MASISVKAEISALSNAASLLNLANALGGISDLLGRSLLLQLVSVELDPSEYYYNIQYLSYIYL